MYYKHLSLLYIIQITTMSKNGIISRLECISVRWLQLQNLKKEDLGGERGRGCRGLEPGSSAPLQPGDRVALLGRHHLHLPVLSLVTAGAGEEGAKVTREILLIHTYAQSCIYIYNYYIIYNHECRLDHITMTKPFNFYCHYTTTISRRGRERGKSV